MVENLENIKHLERIKNFLITPVEKDNFYYYTGKVDVAVSMLKDEIARQDTKTFIKGLLSETDAAGRKLYSTDEATAVGNARESALQNPKLRDRLDNSRTAIPKREIKKLEETRTQVGEKEVKAFKPSGDVMFQENKVYYDFVRGTWMVFKNDLLIPIGQR